MKLSLEQQHAVEREWQDVCVVAGPGSGKTRVLTERFAWLVEQRGVDPSRILAITFTEKAAIEIKQRLVDRFADNATLREGVERAWVSTIDGFCARLLREHALAAGLPPDFAVLEASAAERMQRECAEEALDALFAERPGDMRRLLEALELSTSDGDRQTDLAQGLLDVYEAMRVSGTREVPADSPPSEDVWDEATACAEELLASSEAEWAARFLALPRAPLSLAHFETLGEFDPNLNKLRHAAAKTLKQEAKPRLEAQWLAEWYRGLPELLRAALDRLDSVYRARKRREASVDFADLEEFAVTLLESNAAARFETSMRFDEVLMDELQDTNRVQWRLVELVKTRLFAVGDINQSIYGFRHADPEVFAEYRDGLRQAGFPIDELHDNYRSRPEILHVVSKMLEEQPGIEPRPFHACGEFPDVVGPVVERFCGTGSEGPQTEAAMVAARIQEWSASGQFEYGNIAILVRTLAGAEPFAKALDLAGIPFLITGGRAFLETRETLDLLVLLAALVNVEDEFPVAGVLRGPLVGLSDAELYSLGREGRRRAFEERFGWTRQRAGFVAPDRLIVQVFDACGYWETLTERQRANVDKLLAWLRREFHERPRPLPELLEDLEALRDAQSAADAPPPEAGNAVRIMTVHAAKGLEFDAVFVAALHKRADNRTPPLLFSRDLGLGAKWRNPATGEAVSDAVRSALRERARVREVEEGNRLLYVAMTRARHRLILTHAEQKQKTAWEKLAIAALPHAQTSEGPLVPLAPGGQAPTYGLLLSPPHVDGQYDGSASVTSVALFHACPRKYYLERYLQLEPEPVEAGTGALALGQEVHTVLAGAAGSPEAEALAERFNASEWGRRAASAQTVEREYDFLLHVEDVILRGQIDLWFDQGGETVLVDYKTDRDEGSWEAYALQLRLYALALERVPDRAILYYLRTNRAVEIGLGEEELRTAWDKVREFREAQETCAFPVRPGMQCKKCVFYGGLCPEGREDPMPKGRIFGTPSSFLTPASNGS